MKHIPQQVATRPSAAGQIAAIQFRSLQKRDEVMKPMQGFRQEGVVALALLAAATSYAGLPGTFSAVLSPTSVALNGTSTLTYTLTAHA